ncbi:MAG: Tm-1-like ATP-binding domain-containing protein [Synergistaceae bacterium]|nr:Tm-1-like ATP-binding domain-containing protein [Synergistaceae bacterium]
MKTVAILGTLDTKGPEYKFLKECIVKAGCETLVIDAGIKGAPYFTADITREQVAEAAGESLQAIVDKDDRGYAIEMMRNGAAKIVMELFGQGKFDGIVSLGGTAGTTIGSYSMQKLPVGFPKLQVSTVASGDTRPYVGAKDVTMMYSVVDIAGLNSISKKIISNAGYAIAGMVANDAAIADEKPLITATMFGVTTPCVNKAREYLEEKGYEVLVFHATGTGGQSMEALVEAGFIKGVLDITTTEWCDELVGGVFNAGPNRLEAAAKSGVPQVVSAGALDMVNFGAMDTVPQKFKGRNLYVHNPTVTLMRTTVEENSELGAVISSKLNMCTNKAALMIPLKGVSLIDSPGKPFYGPEEDKALFNALKTGLNNPNVEIIELDNEINDTEFAVAMAEKLCRLIETN